MVRLRGETVNAVKYAYRVWVAEHSEYKATYRLKNAVTETALRVVFNIPSNVVVKPRLDNRLKNGGRKMLG